MTLLLALLACAPTDPSAKGDSPDTGRPDTATPDTATPDTALPCPEGVICVDGLPFTTTADTRDATTAGFDRYACAPTTDESGPALVFRVAVEQAGALGVAIDDTPYGSDIDAHILSALDPDHCLDRGNHDAHAPVEPGYVWVIADTWVDGGVAQSGAFALTIGLAPLAHGSCAMERGSIARVGDGGRSLAMPATGPVAVEAHLVTTADGWDANDWPQAIDEGMDAHYAMTQDHSGFVMWRAQPWAPQEGCEFGQCAYGLHLPPEDEAWYVNMYWRERPDPGTRMILQREDGRAVVVAAGYETGPGDLDYVGGATEEVHAWLGTTHGSTLTLGFAVDQSLPLGPIACE